MLIDRQVDAPKINNTLAQKSVLQRVYMRSPARFLRQNNGIVPAHAD